MYCFCLEAYGLKTSQKNPNTSRIAAIVFLFLGYLLLFLTLWLCDCYDDVSLENMLFQLKTSSEGVHAVLTSSWILRVGLLSVLFTGLTVFVYRLLFGKYSYLLKNAAWHLSFSKTAAYRFFRDRILLPALCVFFAVLVVFIGQFKVIARVSASATESSFIEAHYVDPAKTAITFPETKRNLIYIYLESMESTFGDAAVSMDAIPELTALAEENVNFSGTSGLGGAMTYTGSTWTAAAMVTHTAGVPVKVSLTADSYGAEEDAFLPGIVTLGEILEKEGYRQVLLLGSLAEFHGREPYFTGHGNYEIIDTETLKEAGRLPEDYRVWWGYEDEKLFRFAKEELTRLAASDEPFNFTMLTADTHFPDGYHCSLCEDVYEEPYANVLSCSSKQVASFVSWIQKQPFYENTTVIITGDHLTMDPDFVEDLTEDYVRTVYNCFLNVPVQPVQEKNRQFATVDMFPTTLAALGAKIEGERLGLGVNLFSGEKTLTETYGYDAVETELQKHSDFYEKAFLETESDS